MSFLLSDTLRCPTCRAVQPWSEACRRCGSDLRLLRAAADAFHLAHERCLRRLREGKIDQAVQEWRRCEALHPGPESRRLGALCALVQEDWPTARKLALGAVAE